MFSIIYITAGDMAEARKIGRKLVEERLAACVKFFRSLPFSDGKGA